MATPLVLDKTKIYAGTTVSGASLLKTHLNIDLFQKGVTSARIKDWSRRPVFLKTNKITGQSVTKVDCQAKTLRNPSRVISQFFGDNRWAVSKWLFKANISSKLKEFQNPFSLSFFFLTKLDSNRKPSICFFLHLKNLDYDTQAKQSNTPFSGREKEHLNRTVIANQSVQLAHTSAFNTFQVDFCVLWL